MTWPRSITVAEGIQLGSPALEHEFAEHFLPRLKSFFRARQALPDSIEELTQETIVAALLALRAGRLRELGSLEAFVLSIARHQLAEAFRQHAKLPANASPNDQIALHSLAPELILTVRNEFYGLDLPNQRLLWLILVEGLRPAEVAPLLGLTEDAVRQRKSRLLRALAEKFSAPAVTNRPTPTTPPLKLPPVTTP